MQKCVCFGDSLTSGFPLFTPDFLSMSGDDVGNPLSQYAYWLSDEFEITFINRGIPGDFTGGMIRRFESHVLSFSPDFMILLGGSNDLFGGVPVKTIVSNLEELHLKARKHGIKTIGMTIPSINVDIGLHNPIPMFEQVNDLLIVMFEKHQIPFADIFRGMSDDQHILRAELADPDGVHFNVQGHRRMAELPIPVIRSIR